MSGSAQPQSHLGRALGRGAEWRYITLFVVGMLVPTALAFVPLSSFFGSLFDYSTRAEELVASLDSHAFVEVLRQLGEPGGEGIRPGVLNALLVALVIAPLLAGAALALARKSAPVDLRSLLGDAGELYPRMFRMAIASSLPLGIAAAGAAAAFHFANKAGERALLESSASHATELATFASIILFWFANVTVEAGRAHFAAEPQRRSALGAWWSGVRLTFRRPRQVLGLCFVTTLLGVGLAAVVTGLRLRIPQAGGGSIALAFILGQVAVATLAWGRSSRLVGLAELIRAEIEFERSPGRRALVHVRRVGPADARERAEPPARSGEASVCAPVRRVP